MEMKSNQWNITFYNAYVRDVGSNRTFMELKWWNWLAQGTSTRCSNRTFMELKYMIGKGRGLATNSSNRTFMELKSNTSTKKGSSSTVLIAPLWNWNRYLAGDGRRLLWVLIAPLWNWNWPIAYGERSLYCVLIVPLWNWYGKYHRCIANSPDKKSELFLAGADSLYFPQSLEVQCPFYFTFTISLPALAKNSA